MTEHLTRNDLRRAVLQRLDTFTTEVVWIGNAADYAFADSIIEFAKWYATTTSATETTDTDVPSEIVETTEEP